jgi:hypothetical protein
MSAISEQSVRNCNNRIVDSDKWEQVFGKYERKEGTIKIRYDLEGNEISREEL